MAEDTYRDIADVAESASLRRREAAAAAQQHAPGDPETWAYENRLLLASQPGWGAAWASAVASGIPDPGDDPGVITDGMILAAVQELLAPPVVVVPAE